MCEFKGLLAPRQSRFCPAPSAVPPPKDPATKLRIRAILRTGRCMLTVGFAPRPLPTSQGSALKGRVQVTFMNQHGVEEAGIDGGGVFKEYMDLLTKRAFDPQYALFLATEDQVRRAALFCSFSFFAVAVLFLTKVAFDSR